MLENYDPIILVTRGDELPKKNYEKKLHPTYETSIRLANGSQRHLVIKFFDQYRSLNDGLEKMGIGYGLAFPIDAQFPPTHKTSMFGLGLSEDALQQRCYMLNKWMQALFNNYHILPEKAQLLISDFLSLEDEDETREKNKNYILEMIKKKNEIKLPELIEKVNQEVAGISVSEASKRESDEPPLVLTPEVIAEISEPQIIYDILKVHVLRQVIDSRNRYEATINLISFDEIVDLPNKAQIDGVQYNLFSSTLPPLVITQTFDTYRQLKSQLQESGIFGRDKTDRFNDYNEDSSKAYHGIKLDAEFPKTYTQSAFGLGLNEEQLKTRTALLNRWVIAVFKAYKQFNPQAQEAVREFFEINDPDNTQHQTYITILNGCYEFPKLPPPAPKSSIFGSSDGATRRTSLLGSLLPGGGSNPPPANNNYAPVNISAPTAKPINGKQNNTEDERESDYRFSTATESPAPTNLQLADLQREVIVKDFLSVSVTKGEMLAKRKDEGKKHHGYLTTLRILYYDELDIPEKDKIDSELYEHNISLQLPAKKILKVFDGYRQLKLTLEENNIYSLDSVKEKDKDRDSDVIVIQASFPRTYTRSSLGLSLGENEIKTRTAELNYWLGNILLRYNEYSSNVQDIINEFLNLDDSPAEAENRVILSILKGSFNPPLIDLKKKQKPVKRDSLGGNGNSNGNGNGDHRDSQDSGNNNGEGTRVPPNAGLRINTNTQSVTQGCACVIM